MGSEKFECTANAVANIKGGDFSPPVLVPVAIHAAFDFVHIVLDHVVLDFPHVLHAVLLSHHLGLLGQHVSMRRLVGRNLFQHKKAA